MSTSFSKSFTVLSQHVGLIIGREGVSKRAIEMEHSVDLTIVNSSPGITTILPDQLSEIVISGPTQAQVDSAYTMAVTYVRGNTTKMIQPLISTTSCSGEASMLYNTPQPRKILPASGVTVVPDLARGALIGHVGRSVRILQAITGCQINVQPSDVTSGTTTVILYGFDSKTVDVAIKTVHEIVMAEQLRLAIKVNPATPHAKIFVEIPSDVSFGSICGRNWSYLTQVQLQFGCIVSALNRDTNLPVQLEIAAPTSDSVNRATVAVSKLIEQARTHKKVGE